MNKKSTPFSRQLINAIKSSGVSRYAIWKATGISEATLSRMVNHDGWIGRDAADKLADFLGLEINVRRPPRVGAGMHADARKSVLRCRQ